jgi:CHAD domain-containing protein
MGAVASGESTENGIDRQVERERKFDLAAGGRPPELAAAFPTGSRAESDTVRLVSAYYDTAERDLLAVGITLRKRTGDTDTGWQLKVPVGDSRAELRLPLSAARTRVPKKLADLVVGVALGAPLTPLVTVHTERRRLRWSTPEGVLLAEIADDEVKATAPDAPTDIWSAWRELEVEIGPAGDESLLGSVADLLLEAGATPGTSANKVARALGGPPDRSPSAPARTAGRAVLDYLAAQHAALLAGDLGLRTGTGDDVVHATRVAARRMRSTLRVYGALFDADRVAAFDRELNWYAHVLGGARDAEVQRARFAAAIDALPPEVVLGPVAARIDEHLLGGQVDAQRELTDTLPDRRYLALLRESAGWLSGPPLSAGARKRPGTLRKPARQAAKKAVRRLAAGLERGDDELLHKARKAGKRARYAGELLGLAGVDDTLASEGAVAGWKELQDVLGEHQDSVLASELLRRLGAATADRPDENGFTYGVLYQREQDAAAASRTAAAAWTSPLD